MGKVVKVSREWTMYECGTVSINLLEFDQVSYPQAAIRDCRGNWATPFLNVRGSVIGNAKVNIKTGFHESGPSLEAATASQRKSEYVL
jgi:hypothetical protein